MSALGIMMEMAHICISSAAPPGRRGNCAIHYRSGDDDDSGNGGGDDEGGTVLSGFYLFLPGHQNLNFHSF